MAYNPLQWLKKSIGLLVYPQVPRKDYQASLEKISDELRAVTGVESSLEEKKIIKGLVKFGNTTVRQVMRSRVDITALNLEGSFSKVIEKFNKSGFSRIPVYKGDMDNIEGVLHMKDVFPHIRENENFEWQKLIRPCYFVPETKKIDELLKELQQKRLHIAIVVDEYGGTAGLVTLEDILEEIVGEISDEFDEEGEEYYSRIDDKTYLFESKISLIDFCKIFDCDPQIFDEVKGESESLGGLLLQLNSDLPVKGDKIIFDKFVFIIESVNNKRIKKVKVYLEQEDEINESAEK